MGFRFQKRIKIAPGVRLNVSKSGVSTSLGGRGATVNLSKKGVRTTVGIPGSGLSWSKQTSWASTSRMTAAEELQKITVMLEKSEAKFNKISPQVNKVSASWNKAVESFQGGRGPSAAKLQTLMKRFDTACAGYDKAEDAALEVQEFWEAAILRLNGLSFGVFSGKVKSVRHDLVALTQGHVVKSGQMLTAIDRLRSEVQDELDAEEEKV
ncbi:DUF4236 domain-containing protein [Thalassobius sp. I31.1]|uniref:DUF4236 domain-containing protein n=1 Tax=Thalassobius sp. I31.1 TaxID=2109912 RepID=UPI000D1B5955|nr:DUF4236 domain-containing protein [Thalassobius sp. I31.1]